MNQDLVQATTADAGAPIDHPGTEARIWAARITECWRSSVEGIIRTGRLLVDAKAALPHGAFGQMIETSLPFGERAAQMLMAIAADQRLSNPKFIALLPPSYATLYDLTRLSDADFESAVIEEKINPDMRRSEVASIRPLARIAQPMSDAEVLAGTGEPPGKRALSIAEADPDREAGLHGGSPVPAPMPNGGLAIAHRRDESDDDPREFFPTPPWATRALIERVLRHLNREGHCKFQNAWEPACGEGHMAEVLREYFREVGASDAYDYQYRGDNADVFKYDFLTGAHASAENFDWIITNPPFRRSTDFVLKAISLARTGVAMFVRLSWIEGVTRYEKLLRDDPPSLLSIFTERAPLHKARWEPEGSTFTAYAWLVWIKGMPAQPPFWIPPGCRVALSKPEDVKKFGKVLAEGEEAA